LNETSGLVAADLSGNGLDGTYAASAVLAQPGPTGVSVLGIGDAPMVQIADPTLSIAATADWAVEWWASFGAVSTMNSDTWFNSSGSNSIANGTALVAYYGVESGWDTQSRAFHVPTDGLWHHVVISLSPGGTLSFYLDGALVTSATGGPMGWDGADPVALTLLPINVAEMAFYDHELVAGRVAAHYATVP
jgi:hypothetical protein